MVYVVRINDNEYEVEVEKGTASIVRTTKVESEDSTAEISASLDVKKPAETGNSAGAANGEAIKAPIPGTVLEIKVSTGAKVKKGDILLIIEAMKMENEVLAPKDGVVTEVLVSKGASVQVKDILIFME